jgi:hypothetical protein
MRKILFALPVLMVTLHSCVFKSAYDEQVKENDRLHAKLDSILNSAKDSISITVAGNGVSASVSAVVDSAALHKKDSVLKAAMKNLKISTDEFKGITWYQHKDAPVGWQSFVSAYIGKKDSNVWLRFKISYTANDWLFIKKYDFLVDQGTVFTLSEDRYGEIETDNDGGMIYEWLDRTATQKELGIITALAYSKTAKIRCTGDKYHNDRSITDKERKVLRDVLLAYEAMLP